MRRDLGLDPPERRIGLSAHDFTQALGAPEIILSRAAKVGGAPMVINEAARIRDNMGDTARADALFRRFLHQHQHNQKQRDHHVERRQYSNQNAHDFLILALTLSCGRKAAFIAPL